MRRLFAFVVVAIAILGLMLPVSAEESALVTPRDEVIEQVLFAYSNMGINLTQAEIVSIKDHIDAVAIKYSEKYGISVMEGYSMMYDEMVAALDDDVINNTGRTTYSFGTGTVPLPQANACDVYYVDTEEMWNHVGFYYSSTQVVDAKAGQGVRYFNISNTAAYQAPTGSNDTSAILRLRNPTEIALYTIWSWVDANVPDYGSYDLDFMDNKGDFETEKDAFNCSEIVWRAYMSMNIDLDSTGGEAVYPIDIRYATQLYVVNDTWDNVTN